MNKNATKRNKIFFKIYTIIYLYYNNQILLIILFLSDIMVIKTTSLRIDEEILEEIKILAIKEKTTQQEIINKALKLYLKEKNL